MLGISYFELQSKQTKLTFFVLVVTNKKQAERLLFLAATKLFSLYLLIVCLIYCL